MVVLRRLLTLEQARTELTKGMVLNLTTRQHATDTVDGLGTILQRKRGSCVVYLQVKDAEGRKAQFPLADEYRVNPAELPLDELEMLLGSGSVVFSGR